MRHRVSVAGCWLLLLGTSTGFQLVGRGLRRPRINGQIVTATSSWVPGRRADRVVSKRGAAIYRLRAAKNGSNEPEGNEGPSPSSEGGGVPSDSFVEFTDTVSSAIKESTRSEDSGSARSDSPASSEAPLTQLESSLMKALTDAAASFRRATINATNSNAAEVSAAERLFAMADSDADGVLTLPEFKRWLEKPEGAAAAAAFAMSPESDEAKAVAAEEEATNVQGLVEMVSAEAAAGAKLRVVAGALLEGVVTLAGKAPNSGNKNNVDPIDKSNNNNNTLTTSAAAAAAVAEAAAAAGATDPAAAAAVSAGFAAGFTAGAAAGAAAATGGNSADVVTTPTPLLEAARGVVISNTSPDITPLLPPTAEALVRPLPTAESVPVSTSIPPPQPEDSSSAVTAPDPLTSTLPPPAELSNRPFASLVRDFKRRAVSYKSDWTDGWASRGKVSSAVLLLYVACLAPTVSFGGLAAVLTEGQIGVVEFLVRKEGTGEGGCHHLSHYLRFI